MAEGSFNLVLQKITPNKQSFFILILMYPIRIEPNKS